MNRIIALALKKRTRVAVTALCLAGLLFPLLVTAADQVPTLPIFSGPRVTDAVVYVGVTVEVRFTVGINDEEKLIPASVNLLRFDAKGVRKVVDRLYDDGTHGDWKANDGDFANKITLTETQPGTIKFQVSAGWKGEVQRRMSDIVTIEVLPVPNLEAIWNVFVERLVNKDMEGALRNMTYTAKHDYTKIFDELGAEILATTFKTVRNFKLKSIEGGGAHGTFDFTEDGTDKPGRVRFEIENDGMWRISGMSL
jgi:hypothetical protein